MCTRRYNLVDHYEEEDDDDEGDAMVIDDNDGSGSSKSDLPAEVQALVRTIFDHNEMKRTMAALGINASKMPLGKLSKTVIKQAYVPHPHPTPRTHVHVATCCSCHSPSHVLISYGKSL